MLELLPLFESALPFFHADIPFEVYRPAIDQLLGAYGASTQTISRKDFINKIPLFVLSPKEELAVEIILMAKATALIHNFFFDFVSQGLIEGKRLSIRSSKSLMIHYDGIPLYLIDAVVKFESEIEMALVIENLKEYHHRIQLSALSIGAQSLPQGQSYFSSEIKKGIILQNFFKFTDRFAHFSRFDALSFALERLNQIEAILDYPLSISSRLLRIFYQHHYLFSQHGQTESPHHLAKIKMIKVATAFHSGFDCRFVAILSFNLRNKYEIFDLDNFHAFVGAKLKKLCLDKIQEVTFSEGSEVHFRVFYLEMRHLLDHPFDQFPLQRIQAHIQEAALKSIKQLQLPLFKPRNEEEIMKDIVMLSKQLTHPTDLPQVIIHFDHHNLKQLVFRVIIIRVKLPDKVFLYDELQELKRIIPVTIERMKTIGFIRKKFPKEASVLSFNVNTKNFVREDHTIDFQKARLEILQNLMKVFGPVRDFEGGMIAKQAEAFEAFQKEVLQHGTVKLITLENFFYGIYPAEFRSIIPVEELAECFFVWKSHKKPAAIEGKLIFFMSDDEESKIARDMEFFQERSFKLHQGFWMKFMHEGVFHIGAMIKDEQVIKEVCQFFGSFL